MVDKSAAPAPARPDARGSGEHEAGLQLIDYWHLFVRRRWIVLGTLAVVVGTTALLNLVATPEFEATTTLQIQRQGPEILTFKDVLGVDQAAYQDFYQTQYRVMQSRAVVDRAVESVDLVHRPEYAARRVAPLERLVGLLHQGDAPDDEDSARARARRFVERGLRVEPVRKSHLVAVSFVDRDAVLSRDLANALADAYQQFSFDARFSTTTQAKEFLTRQVARLQSELLALEKKLQEYGAAHELTSLGDGTRDISEQGLAELNGRLIAAKGELAVAEARLQALEGAQPDELPDLLRDDLITSLKRERAEIERSYSQMAGRFKPDWPKLIELRDALQQAEERLDVEIDQRLQNARGAARTAAEEVRTEVHKLERLLDTQKIEVQRVNAQAIEYAGLKSEIETKRKILSDLSSRHSETEASDHLRDTHASNIRVIDRAIVPQRPIRPRKLLNLVLSLGVGLAFGVGLALLLDYVDNTVKTEHDLVRVAGLPVLGHVPLAQLQRTVPPVPAEAARPPSWQLDLVSHFQPRSHVAECFRNLRTSLLMASAEHPPRTIVITSCEPGAGKSTVSLNTAAVLTQLGRRVVLIDADLRRPRIHHALGLENQAGLSSLLSGNADLAPLLQDCEIPGLQVITAGPIPPNPSELLGASSLPLLIRRLTTEFGFDHVLFDSPPVLHVTDAVMLSTHADGTILVVRAGGTRREALMQSVSRLRSSRANLLGGLLNGVDEGRSLYYYGRYRYSTYEEPKDGESSTPPRRGRRADRRA